MFARPTQPMAMFHVGFRTRCIYVRAKYEPACSTKECDLAAGWGATVECLRQTAHSWRAGPREGFALGWVPRQVVLDLGLYTMPTVAPAFGLPLDSKDADRYRRALQEVER